MFRRFRPLLLAAATGLVLLAAACRGDQDGSAQTAGGGAAKTAGGRSASAADATVASAESATERRIARLRRTSGIACNPAHRLSAIRTGAEPLCAPFDSIPAVGTPELAAPGAGESLADEEPVVAVSLNGDARAYPVRYLIFHEVVNDEVGGVPVVISFCPLCNSAVAHERRVDDMTLTFGVSGQLAFANLVMFDRETASFWHQLTGRATSGEFRSHQLEPVAVQVVSYGDWLADHADGLVLQPPDALAYPYGTDPYGGYDVDPSAQSPVLQHSAGPPQDARLPPKWRVAGALVGDVAVAFPMPEGDRGGAVREQLVADERLVAFFRHGTIEAETDRDLAAARRGWSGAVWIPRVDGRDLTFEARGSEIVETTTGSAFSILGLGLSGELEGVQLAGPAQLTSFWFSWVHFYPDTLLWGDAPR